MHVTIKNKNTVFCKFERANGASIMSSQSISSVDTMEFVQVPVVMCAQVLRLRDYDEGLYLDCRIVSRLTAIARLLRTAPERPDCVKHPNKWAECVQAFADEFGAADRLLPVCSHLGCMIMTGAVEYTQLKAMMMCGGCRSARYCSVDCQSADWHAGGHHVFCTR